MRTIFLVTGNPNKLVEWRRLLPETIAIETLDSDLTEIQSSDAKEIVIDKVRRAYEATGKPVVVEDVSASLDELNGLPGPFVKFFMKAMGDDVLHTLAVNNKAATISCAVAFYDGVTQTTVVGETRGTIVAPRGSNGFGFDATFMPNGATKTYAEMTADEKDSASHRSKAIKLFIEKLLSE